MEKLTTVRALLAIAAIKGWQPCQIDVSNAFLHGDLYEQVYMQLSEDYEGPGSSINTNTQRFVVRGSMKCRLLKSLYGLKQAPRQWLAKLSSALLLFEYMQSKVHNSLLIK